MSSSSAQRDIAAVNRRLALAEVTAQTALVKLYETRKKLLESQIPGLRNAIRLINGKLRYLQLARRRGEPVDSSEICNLTSTLQKLFDSNLEYISRFAGDRNNPRSV